MTFQHQQDQDQDQGEQQQKQQQPSAELDNLIEQFKDTLLKVRELLIKIEETARSEGFTNSDEIDIMIHQRYVDGLRNEIKK
jgi:hypothetical protein